jgi:putative endonuclease
MTYYVYIIYSKSIDKYYKGYTSNLLSRIKSHNYGNSTYTKNGIPWVLKLSIEKKTKFEAIILERKLKNLNRERLETFMLKYKNT